MEIRSMKISEVRPYPNNPRINKESVDKVAASIKEFGFRQPIVVDKNNVIIVGHTRLKAAKKLKLKEVPVMVAADLTDEQANAYRLADNKAAEFSLWDDELLAQELDGIFDIDMEQFGFDFGTEEAGSWFDREHKEGAERQEGNDEYNEFLDKFENPKTTDDCYTPDKIYDAVADWVVNEYGVNRADFVRPFYPGGDYQNEKYKKNDIVVDNPPFSILSEIINFYTEKKIRFFLFAPELTIFSSSSSAFCCAICCGYQIEYENRARVSTGFITNLEGTRFRSAPVLYKALDEAMQEIRAETKTELPKYSYPAEVVLSTMLSQYSKYGIDFRVSRAESYHIRQLDAQKELDKTLYGSGYLISEKAAAEKAAAEKAAAEKAAAMVWRLSDREKEIIRNLGGQ